MSIEIERRIAYERLQNGTDVYVLKTPSRDIAVLNVAIPLVGSNRAYHEKRSVFTIVENMFPFGVRGMSRHVLLESLEKLGATVSLTIGKEYVYLSLLSRSSVFYDAVALLFESFTKPVVTKAQWDISMSRVLTQLHHARENTKIRAHVSLVRAMYAKGHQHWEHEYNGALKELRSVTFEESKDVCRHWSVGTGAIVCVSGDLDTKKMIRSLRTVLGTLASEVDDTGAMFDTTKVRTDAPMFDIVSMKGKHNVDTLFGIPLAITVSDSSFPALYAGVHILGGSSTSRLFTTLRTKKSLTYGAYASLQAFSPSYPGYLAGMAVLPSDVFTVGRDALRDVVEAFFHTGVTHKELREYKEEKRGIFTIGLASTVGMNSAVFGTLVNKKPISYLENYLDELDTLTVREVNEAIWTHIPIEELKIVGAGAIDKDGKPI